VDAHGSLPRFLFERYADGASHRDYASQSDNDGQQDPKPPCISAQWTERVCVT
jgi:hypothetical protein